MVNGSEVDHGEVLFGSLDDLSIVEQAFKIKIKQIINMNLGFINFHPWGEPEAFIYKIQFRNLGFGDILSYDSADIKNSRQPSQVEHVGIE